MALSTTLGLYPTYPPVKYSYFSDSPDDNAEILDASQSKSYWAWFALIVSSRILSSSAVLFIMYLKDILHLKELPCSVIWILN